MDEIDNNGAVMTHRSPNHINTGLIYGPKSVRHSPQQGRRNMEGSDHAEQRTEVLYGPAKPKKTRNISAQCYQWRSYSVYSASAPVNPWHQSRFESVTLARE